MSMGSTPGGNHRSGRRWAGNRTFLKFVLAAVVTITALFLAHEDRRIEQDPRFCATSCHHDVKTAASPAFHAGGHEGIPCQECHRTPLAKGIRLEWASVVGRANAVKHGEVSAAECTACHGKRPAEWRLVAETAGHREHRGVTKVDCISCHGAATHAKTAEVGPSVCITCHKDERLHKAATVGAETCLSCHSYALSAKNRLEPTTIACAKCHDNATALAASAGGAAVRPMKDIDSHSLHSGVACQLCHNAHGIKRKVPEGQPSCSACHKFENFQVANEQRTGPAEHWKCEGCHKPHLPRETALQRCVDCHEKNAKGLLGATTAKGTRTTALKHKSCASCHLPHTWKAERSGCMQCHKDQTKLFQTRSPPEHKACTSCHDVHGPPPSGAVCLKCHAKTKGNHVALAPERHKDCTACHNPHAPKPEDTRLSCAKCHTAELAQIMRDGPEPHAKESCFTCHKPHNNPMPDPNVCATCHAERAKLVATAVPPKHRVCISCHQRHVFKISDVVGACSRCHSGLFDTSDKSFVRVPHQGDCKNCHTFHGGSPGVPKARCLTCHEKVAAKFNPPNQKHADCRSCHKPHTPANTAPDRCATCHADKASIAAMWPPASAHAKSCVNCHQPHAAREKKACNECHAPEAQSAMGSKHECKQCHPPHGAPPGTGHAWWSRCNACHAAKVASVKERGQTHAECKNCHQPHRFAVPTCVSCHKDMSNRGLHGVAKHADNCTSCHDPHVKSMPQREQCLTCHTDRRNHEPTAKECFTCHMFQ